MPPSPKPRAGRPHRWWAAGLGFHDAMVGRMSLMGIRPQVQISDASVSSRFLVGWIPPRQIKLGVWVIQSRAKEVPVDG